MNVAFYAPLKPPDHPTPSGDRAIARLLAAALARAGHRVTLASRFRSREVAGDPARQRRLERLGGRLARRLADRLLAREPEGRPDLWFTYHLYDKAPDFLGPVVAARLGIPYVVAEASHAPSRARSAWSAWHAIAARSIAAADLVLTLNSDDLPGLHALLGSDERVRRLPLFVDAAPLRAVCAPACRRQWVERWSLDPESPWVLAVAMMRPGRKVECFEFLARILETLERETWQLLVVGDGEGAAQVRRAFGPLGARVRFLGALAPERLPAVYAACDVLAWPAIGEPLGLVLLEAQAAGLPVVAGAARGVPDLVCANETGLLVPEGDPRAFRDALGALLCDPLRRRRMGAAARAHVERDHALPGAARRLDELLHAVADRGVPR